MRVVRIFASSDSMLSQLAATCEYADGHEQSERNHDQGKLIDHVDRFFVFLGLASEQIVAYKCNSSAIEST